MNNKYKNLTKNTLIFAVSNFGTKFLSFFLMPLYTNILSTKEYGIADVITATSSLLIYVFTINIASSVLRFAIDRKKAQDEILSYGIRVVFVGSLILVGVLAIAMMIGIKTWENYYYLFIFLHFISTGLYQLMSNYLRAIDRIFDVGIAGIISSAMIMTSSIILLLVCKIGIIGYLISLCIGPFLGTIYCIIKANVPISKYLSCTCDEQTKKSMRTYCIPLIFNDLALWINVFLDKYFVTAICGPDQNGIYAVANKIPTILATVYMVFTQAWNLSAIKEFDSEDKDGFFSNIYSLYNATIALACSVLILLNISIAKILFAKDFFSGWQYSSILMIAIMFNAMTSFQGSIYSAAKDTKILARTTMISAGINICFNVILIPIIGVIGAAIATVLSYVSMWAIRHISIKKHILLHHNFVIDFVVYIFLILQVVIEHTKTHMYNGQIIILCLIIVIYRKQYITLIDLIKTRLRKKK